MIVTKIGNSLAVELPAEDVARLGLKEGDAVELYVSRVKSPSSGGEAQQLREAAFKRLRGLRGMIPADFKFDRDEANER